jgi:hypothetical protein
MIEHDPGQYIYFKDYVRDVVDYEWLKIVAEDARVGQAHYLLQFDTANPDRSREANLLADVAEQYGLRHAEQMEEVLAIWNSNLVHGYEQA